MYDFDSNVSIENYGFALFDSGVDRYLVSSTPNYLQSNFNGEENILDSVDNNGLILLNPKIATIHSDITKDNIFDGIHINSGWNLISNIFDENISLENIFTNDELIWLYRDGEYFAYSADPTLQQIIKDRNLSVPNNTITANEGIWVYSDSEEVIDIDKSKLTGYNFNLKNGWNLLSIASSAFNVDEIVEPVTIWHFDNATQNWQVYTNRDIEIPYDKIQKILPGNGYFVYLSEN